MNLVACFFDLCAIAVELHKIKINKNLIRLDSILFFIIFYSFNKSVTCSAETAILNLPAVSPLEFIPIKSPFLLNKGPPEFPKLIAALCTINLVSKDKSSDHDQLVSPTVPRKLIVPSAVWPSKDVLPSSSPVGEPKVLTKPPCLSLSNLIILLTGLFGKENSASFIFFTIQISCSCASL